MREDARLYFKTRRQVFYRSANSEIFHLRKIYMRTINPALYNKFSSAKIMSRISALDFEKVSQVLYMLLNPAQEIFHPITLCLISYMFSLISFNYSLHHS